MADGLEIYFEIDETNLEVLAPSGSTEGLSEAAGELAEWLERINATIPRRLPLARRRTNALNVAKPDEFEIEFGISRSAKARMPMVTKGGAQAVLKILARW